MLIPSSPTSNKHIFTRLCRILGSLARMHVRLAGITVSLSTRSSRPRRQRAHERHLEGSVVELVCQRCRDVLSNCFLIERRGRGLEKRQEGTKERNGINFRIERSWDNSGFGTGIPRFTCRCGRRRTREGYTYRYLFIKQVKKGGVPVEGWLRERTKSARRCSITNSEMACLVYSLLLLILLRMWMITWLKDVKHWKKFMKKMKSRCETFY